MTRANNDDGEAFRALFNWSSEDEPYKSVAYRALVNIATNGGITLTYTLDSKKVSFDPEKASLPEYGAFIHASLQRADYQLAAIDRLWLQDRFSKYEKLEFLIGEIQSTTSIRVLEQTCRLANSEAKIDKNILAWGEYVKWWAENQGKYRPLPPPKIP